VQPQPGVDPAYTVFEVAITPTGGLNVAGAQEAATRSRYEVLTPIGLFTIAIWLLGARFIGRCEGQFSGAGTWHILLMLLLWFGWLSLGSLLLQPSRAGRWCVNLHIAPSSVLLSIGCAPPAGLHHRPHPPGARLGAGLQLQGRHLREARPGAGEAPPPCSGRAAESDWALVPSRPGSGRAV
jgi:hypothetical protein